MGKLPLVFGGMKTAYRVRDKATLKFRKGNLIGNSRDALDFLLRNVATNAPDTYFIRPAQNS